MDRIKKIFRRKTDVIEFSKAEITTLIEKAKYAQELIENPLFNEILKCIENELINTWKNSPARDVEGRETTYMRLEALRKIEMMIKGYIAEAIYKSKKED